MFKNLINFFKTMFDSSHPVKNNFAVLNNSHNKTLEARVKRLELASLTMLKNLVQLNTELAPKDLKIDKQMDKFLLNNYLADDSNQPTIH